jgi:C4-dicarboxylate transporter DctM subunit
MTLALILLGLVLLLLTGLPIFAGLGLASMVLLLIVDGQIGSLADIVFAKLNVYLLVAIPMFAFMAHVMIRSKVVDDLYATAHVMVRHLPGGLGVATVLSCTVFAAISGSSVATALTIGATAIPQMTRYGYKPRNIYGVVAAGGTLGILIPPSGPMILYGIVSETSIGALFFAGLIPGLILAVIFAAYAMWASGHGDTSTRRDRASLAEVGGAIKRSLAALSLPPLVLGGLYFGVFTPTEAAGAGAFASLLIATLLYRNFGFRDLYETTSMRRPTRPCARPRCCSWCWPRPPSSAMC